MEMASRIITVIRSTLDDLQSVREVYFEYVEQISIRIVMHKLRGLITFLLCSARLDNNDSTCRSPRSQKDKLEERQKRMKIGLESLLVRVEDVCKVVGNNEFDESLVEMQSLEEEVDEYYTSLSDYLQQSCPSVVATDNQVTAIFDSVLVNLDDFLSFHIANVGALIEPIEALKDNIAFLRNFICFAILLCTENTELQDLLTHSDTLAISAAHLTVHLFSSSHYNFEVLYEDVENARENFPSDGLKSMISAFSLRINLVDNNDLYETYSRALAGLKCSRELYLPTLNMNDAIAFLLATLWGMLQLYAGPVVSRMDQLGSLYKGLKSLEAILNRQANRFDGNLRDIAGSAIFDAGIIIFSLHQKDFTIDHGIQDFLENIKVIHTQVGEQVGSTTEADESINTMELSYECLPDHLKSCLLSFGAFPKDQEVSVKRLIWFWIAEGFIQKSDSKSLQEVATSYLKGLIDRSLVISVKERSGGGIKTCRIHDSVHAFCLKKVNEEFFLHLITGNEELLSFDEPENLRRLCIYSKLEYFMKSKLFCPRLRSLLFFHPREWLEKVDISFIFRIYKLLRVLDMEKVNIHSSDFSGEVGFLVQLRYLAIQATYDVSPSIGNLSNLEFFVLYPAREGIVTLPHTVWNLQSLRHVYLICKSTEFSGIQFPVDNLDNSCNLLELESLSGLHSEHWSIMEKQLRKFPNIRRLKCWLSELGDDPLNGINVMSFSYLSKLESLSLSFDDNSTEFEFNFPETIRKLALRGCGLSWEKISKIAELPNLEVLKLLDESFIGDTWHMDEGKFLKLTFLKLVTLRFVKWTASDDQCPNLRKLILEDCPKLETVPKWLGNVGTLELIEVTNCPNSVSNLFKKIKDCQKGNGNSVLHLHVHPTTEA